jgi:N utilization substance protein B
MITRRQIRAKVMQAVYACITSGQTPDYVFDLLLKDLKQEVEELETKKKLSGDTKLLTALYYESMKHTERYDEYIQSKAENWELERIARLDRILMHMAICEMLNFEEIPVKVTINEYLELAKTYSTPKSSKFINGILDSLYNDFRTSGLIVKRGRGLIDHSVRNSQSQSVPEAESGS